MNVFKKGIVLMKNFSYENEASVFKSLFSKYKKKKIVLYGIGRRSASLIPYLKEFTIVGLMDRDSENLGKVIFGIPVISEKEAEDIADMVIINTAESYWETIYKRIADIKIPVLYRNGEEASLNKQFDSYSDNDYWNTSYADLKEIAKRYDIISFDLFDTLLARNVCLPQDVFEIVDRRIRNELGMECSFAQLRSSAIANLNGKDILLDEIYAEMHRISSISECDLKKIQHIELDVEESLIIPRKDLINLYNEMILLEKEIYFLSDMYFPKEFLIRILRKCGVREVDENNLWVSGELKVSKCTGTMWKDYKEKVVKDRKALHIGDNIECDIVNAEKHGIDTYYIMNGIDMLKSSSIGEITPHICTNSDSIAIGLIISKLFNNPFALNQSKGKIQFNDFHLLGYCLFGPIVNAFLFWLIKNAKKENIQELVFFARDGYFLVEDYGFLVQQLSNTKYPKATYLAISRRLIMTAAIENNHDFYETMSFPYCGTFKEYMRDRFDVVVDHQDDRMINTVVDLEHIEEIMKPHVENVWENIKEEKENYLNYLKDLNLDSEFAVVDTGYYGNSQYYLSKFLKKSLTGYYFIANISKENRCCKNNLLIPCFQEETDRTAQKSNVFKKMQILESVLTAPYGMIKKIDKNNKLVCDEKKGNQIYFDDKIKINEGIKEYINDFIKVSQINDIESFKMDVMFVDALFGMFLENNCSFGKEIQRSFFWDNGIVQRRESKIFD